MYLAKSQPIVVFEVLENAKDNQLNIWHHLKHKPLRYHDLHGNPCNWPKFHPKFRAFSGRFASPRGCPPQTYLLPMARLAHLPSSKSLDLPDFPPKDTTILSKQKPFIYIYIHKEPLDLYVFVCFELFALSAVLPSRRVIENPKITPLGRSERSGRRRAAWPWDLESCRIWRDVVTDVDAFFCQRV